MTITRNLSPIVIALGALVACQEIGRSPSSPSGATPTAQEVALQCSPDVGVHADGLALSTYEDALSALRRAGRLNGVRRTIRQQAARAARTSSWGWPTGRATSSARTASRSGTRTCSAPMRLH